MSCIDVIKALTLLLVLIFHLESIASLCHPITCWKKEGEQWQFCSDLKLCIELRSLAQFLLVKEILLVLSIYFLHF